LTCNAEVREQIAAVRRDVQHDTRIIQADRTSKRLTRYERAMQREDAAVVATEPQLGSTAQHALTRLAADLRLADLQVVRQRCTNRCERIVRTRLHVRCATHHAERFRATRIDGA